MMMGFGFGGWWMMVWMVLFWVVIVGLALWLLSRLFPGTREHSGSQQSSSNQTSITGSRQALDLLKERYARGEITKAEYQEIRHDLEG